MTTVARRAIHVVPHTHWDREWYEPFQTFRMKLVDLVDSVIELMEAHPSFRFTLDGQLATVDDYLQVRPERTEQLRAYVAEGRLAIGPWQILMDEFLPSGETIVRNLEKGWTRGTAFGGVMPVGYLPDMFGHVAQMPQILHRAGLADAVLWRGVPAVIDRHVFRWVAPDGSAVRTEFLANGGYGNAAHLLAIPEALADKVDAFVREMDPYFGDDELLAMLGTDHAHPVPEVVELIENLNSSQSHFDVRLATLQDYIRQVHDSTRIEQEWNGELRAAARANLLPGVTSTRVDSKRAGGRAERALERFAEPLCTLYGEEWPDQLLGMAWDRLIDNSAHDSICSCSVDEVVDQVMVRYAEAEQIARGLTRKVLTQLAARVASPAHVVVNPTPHPRRGLVEIDVPGEDAGDLALRTPDGALHATQQVQHAALLLLSRTVPAAEALAPFDMMHGRELYGRLLNRCTVDRDGDIPSLTFHVDYTADPPSLDVDLERARVQTAVAGADDPSWRVRILGRAHRTVEAMVPAPSLGAAVLEPVAAAGALQDGVRVGSASLDNDLISVLIASDGTLTVEGNGSRLVGVAQLVNGGDAGDSYNYGPPEQDGLVTDPEFVDVHVTAPGPVRGTISVRREYQWPVRLQADRRRRSSCTLPVATETTVEVRAGEPFVRLSVAFDNPCEDQRLRLHIPLPSAVDESYAAGQFGVARRGLEVEAGHGEHPLPTFPAHGFVATDGVAALLEHVTEYEIIDDGKALALTVLRSIGQISRNVHPYREEPAGPEIPTPAAQCRGPQRFDVALFPYRGRWHEAGVVTQAERYRHPFMTVAGTGEVTDALPTGLHVEGDGVELTALRQRGEWDEARLVCLSPVGTTATVGPAVKQARRTDLLGRPGDALPVSEGEARVPLQPWEIATLQLQR